MTAVVSRGRWLVFAATVAAASFGCDTSQSPSSLSSLTSLPDATLSVTGPPSISGPGASIQLRALVTSPGGATRDVTANAEWQVRSGSAAKMSGPGVVTGIAFGTVTVVASYGGVLAGWPVRIVPDAAFLLTVSLSSFEGTFLKDCVVNVSSSAGTFSTLAWVVAPARGDTTVSVQAPGRATITRHVAVSSDMLLDVTVPRVGAGPLSGHYALTFVLSPACSWKGSWTYDVDMEEWEDTLLVLAHGASFVAFGRAGFSGKRTGNAAWFSIRGDYGDLSLVDGDRAYSGTASGTINERAFLGRLDGSIGGCTAPDHSMTMVRAPE